MSTNLRRLNPFSAKCTVVQYAQAGVKKIPLMLQLWEKRRSQLMQRSNIQRDGEQDKFFMFTCHQKGDFVCYLVYWTSCLTEKTFVVSKSEL